MPDAQANPTTDDKISALEALVTKLAHKVDGMVSRNTMMRADSVRGDEDDEEEKEKRDDAARSDEEKAKKDAARDTLFGGKRKDAAKRDEKRGDEDEDEDEEEDEEERKKKEAKGDEDKEEEEDKDKRDDADEEPEPMASDDDRRKDRKDAARDDDARGDKHNSPKRAHWRGDEDKEEEKEKRDDAARADSLIHGLKQELAELKRSMRRPRPMTDDEMNALAERQQEWDRVAQMHGQRASRPLDGERIESYDRRLAKMFQKHSAKWADTDLSAMPIEVVNRVIAPEIRADSISAAYRVEPAGGGLLREVRKADRTGRIISEFVGPVDAVNGALAPFRMPSAYVRRINTQPNQF